MARKRMTGKERLAKYAAGGIAKYPTGGELGPTPPAPAPYIPDAFQPFSKEYEMYAPPPPKAKGKPIKLKDTRTVNPVTGKAYTKDQMGSKTLSVDPAILQAIIAHAKAKGVDPLDALAVPYQESNFGAAGTGLGEVKDYFPDDDVSESFNDLDERNMNMEANQMVKALKDKFDYAKRLGYTKKGRDYVFQAYNGYGKLRPPKGQSSTSYYGRTVTNDAPLDMASNPLYGKVVSSLRGLLENNPEIQKLIKETKAYVPYSGFATGGEAGDPQLSDLEKYYQNSAKLSYYKNQLNEQLKAKNPKGYQDYFKGLVDLRRSGNAAGAKKFTQDSQWNDFLSPKEVKASLGDKYQDYLDSLKQVNAYDVAQGKEPLYGDVEGENDLTKLNYGRRFASLMVTPSLSVTNKTRGTSYNRNYTYNPQTGAVDYTEQGDLNLRPSELSVRKMAEGGEVEIPGMPDMSSTTAGGGGGWAMAGQLLPQVGNLLQTLFTKPQQQTNQPIVNAQTAKAMTAPYAMGGELDDVDDYQYQEWLQAMFNNQLAAEAGLDDEQAETLSEGVGEEDESDEDSYAMGGKAKHKIHINPKNKGKFNALKKRTGKTTEQLTHSKNPLTRKRAIFAQNAAKWKHAYGGPAYANGGMTDIEVEGDEVVQTPDGQMQDMQGPSHEQGGIPMSVPVGTKIYSDRLQVEGKTMQERKKSREKNMRKAEETWNKNRHDLTARNTYERTKQVYDMEEQQDMALQKVANKIYSAPRKAAYGDEVGDPWSDYMETIIGSPATKVPFRPGADTSQVPGQGSALSTSMTGRGVNVAAPSVTGRTAENIGLQTPTDASRYNVPEIPEATPSYSGVGGFTTGDYIGMGANLFNAIAPIINTKNAARATKPEINRFKGFGRQALEANAKAQDFAGVNFANAKRDLDTASNSAILRNRLGARSINTMRALDTVTDLNRNKAAAGLYGQYTNQLSGLLGQEGQLANQRDQVVMSGEQARDQREAQNTDNYYSNMAQNLTNFGTNVGNIGAQLNKHKANQDNADLISQLSEYFDFGRDQQGKLVLKNKGR